MSATEKNLNLFTTRVRQMILQYKDVKDENSQLYAMVDDRDKLIEQMQKQITQLQNDYNGLKMAKMLEITDGDLEGAQKRVTRLIRDVNKCITLLNDK
jgi:hypothetical protein